MKSLLNSLLPDHHQIDTLSFRSNEATAWTDKERRAVFDLYCQSASGERFIVELQKQKQDLFKDRMVYYTTFPIQEQAIVGDWNFRLDPVYCVGILNFCFDDHKNDPNPLREIKLKDQNNRIFYENLTFLTVEMPKFVKTEAQLEDDLDRWLYFLKNLERFEEIPSLFMGREEFETAFSKAHVPLMTRDEHAAYQQSLKHYRDLTNVVDSAFNEVVEEGIEKGIQKALEKLIISGISEVEARRILGLG